MFESLFVVIVGLGLASLCIVLAYRMAALARNEHLMLHGMAGGAPAKPGFRGAKGVKSVKRGRGVADDDQRRLYRALDSGNRIATTAATDRTELVTQLHILFGLQDRVCRQHRFILKESPLQIQQYAAAWFYGAASALSAPCERHSDKTAEIVCQLLERKIGLDRDDAAEAIAGLTRCSVRLACYRCGLEGAEHWREHHFIPSDNALNTALTSNAFI